MEGFKEGLGVGLLVGTGLVGLEVGTGVVGFMEGTKDGDIEIVTPIISWKKSEIVKKCLELDAPIHLSWSCYESDELACGLCDSCELRLKGFKELGKKDPISYQL